MNRWIILGLFSVFGAVIWMICYYLSVCSRIRLAEKKKQKPKLSLVRIFYLVTGILGQVFYWQMIIMLYEWDGMN